MSVNPDRLVSPAFITLAAATLAFFVGGGIVLPVAPQFASAVIGAAQLGGGVSIGAFSIAALVLRPVVGWSADRFGRRPLLVGGSLLTAVALGLHFVAGDLVVFIAARALLGAGEGFFLVAALTASSLTSDPALRVGSGAACWAITGVDASTNVVRSAFTRS